MYRRKQHWTGVKLGSTFLHLVVLINNNNSPHLLYVSDSYSKWLSLLIAFVFLLLALFQRSLCLLTYFDMPWVRNPPVQLLFFYESPHLTYHFIETTFLMLKGSLSLTLLTFFTLCI